MTAPESFDKAGRAPMEHELKCWPEYFEQVVTGRKPFEIRKNDRDFRVGDTLWLREWVLPDDPTCQDAYYTGLDCRRTVTYITDFGQWQGRVVMGIAPLPELQHRPGGYDQDALDAASREVHMMLLREGSSWGTKACEEMGRVFMTAYLKAAPQVASQGSVISAEASGKDGGPRPTNDPAPAGAALSASGALDDDDEHWAIVFDDGSVWREQFDSRQETEAALKYEPFIGGSGKPVRVRLMPYSLSTRRTIDNISTKDVQAAWDQWSQQRPGVKELDGNVLANMRTAWGEAWALSARSARQDRTHRAANWIACSKGGLWECVDCKESYCSPPWSKEKMLAEKCISAIGLSQNKEKE